MHRRLLLDVVVVHGTVILQLLAAEDQPLLVICDVVLLLDHFLPQAMQRGVTASNVQRSA